MNRIQSIKIKLNIPTLNPKERYKQGTTQHKLSNYYKKKGKSKLSKKNPYPKGLWVGIGKAKITPLTARKRSTTEREEPTAKSDMTGKEACGQREEPRLREARGRGKH